MKKAEGQVVTVSFFRFEGRKNKWWAFGQMGALPKLETIVPGIKFAKMLGSGAKEGFSILPNFSVYGLLLVWENEQHAETFFTNHPIPSEFAERSTEQWTVFMQNNMAHGFWDGVMPFEQQREFNSKRLVAVLTRATIKAKFLWRFWRFVPKVSSSVQDKKGRIFSVGVGELPLIQQATFSLWESSDLMMEYAYKSKYHKEVVQKTRALGWYKEELFARFEPYKSKGTWNGILPLQNYLPTANID